MSFEMRPLSCQDSNHLSKLASLDNLARPENHWSFSKFRAELGNPRTHGVGCFDNAGNLLGFLVFDYVKPNHIELVAIAVDPNRRRQKVGSNLVSCLTAAIKRAGVPARLVVPILEGNDVAWRFFRSYAKASGVEITCKMLRGKGGEQDTYEYTFKIQPKEEKKCQVSSRSAKT